MLFWLAYQQGDTRCIMVVRAHSLIAARLRAAPVVEGIEDVALSRGTSCRPPRRARCRRAWSGDC